MIQWKIKNSSRGCRLQENIDLVSLSVVESSKSLYKQQDGATLYFPNKTIQLLKNIYLIVIL